MTRTIDKYQDMRDALRALCAQFPDEYHRRIDQARGCTDEVRGGIPIPEEILLLHERQLVRGFPCLLLEFEDLLLTPGFGVDIEDGATLLALFVEAFEGGK